MNDMAEIKAKADRLVKLTNQQSVIKAEIDEIKAWFEKLATDDLKDTKKKTIQSRENYETGLEAVKSLVFEAMAKENPELYRQVSMYLNKKKNEGLEG